MVVYRKTKVFLLWFLLICRGVWILVNFFWENCFDFTSPGHFYWKTWSIQELNKFLDQNEKRSVMLLKKFFTGSGSLLLLFFPGAGLLLLYLLVGAALLLLGLSSLLFLLSIYLILYYTILYYTFTIYYYLLRLHIDLHKNTSDKNVHGTNLTDFITS